MIGDPKCYYAKFIRWLSRKMPKMLVYYCALRVCNYADSKFDYAGNHIVYDKNIWKEWQESKNLTFDILRTWENDHKLKLPARY